MEGLDAARFDAARRPGSEGGRAEGPEAPGGGAAAVGPRASQGFAARTSSLVEGLPFSAVSRILSQAAAQGWSDALPLAGGEPRFPFPHGAMETLRSSDEDALTKYSPFTGQSDLLSAIRSKLKLFNNIDAHEENIICVPGGSAAIYNALMAVVDPGSEVIVSDPCWEHYISTIRLCGANPVRFRMAFTGSRYEVDMDSLRAAITPRTRAILLNTPLNPSGAVLRREEAEAILAEAHRHGIWVIVDEEYEAFLHDGNSLFSMGSIDPNVITLHSFSKTFALTGTRLGYVVAPARIIDLVRRVALYTHMYPPAPSQRMALGALSGDYMRYIEGVRAHYEGLMDRLYRQITAIPGVECWRPEGGVYLFPRLPRIDDRPAGKVLIDDHHLLCVPGEVAGETGEGHVRLFYGVRPELLDEAARRIGAMMAQARQDHALA
jgi:aspartate/methionine/tyrosine aminotransferase